MWYALLKHTTFKFHSSQTMTVWVLGKNKTTRLVERRSIEGGAYPQLHTPLLHCSLLKFSHQFSTNSLPLHRGRDIEPKHFEIHAWRVSVMISALPQIPKCNQFSITVFCHYKVVVSGNDLTVSLLCLPSNPVSDLFTVVVAGTKLLDGVYVYLPDIFSIGFNSVSNIQVHCCHASEEAGFLKEVEVCVTMLRRPFTFTSVAQLRMCRRFGWWRLLWMWAPFWLTRWVAAVYSL